MLKIQVADWESEQEKLIIGMCQVGFYLPFLFAWIGNKI